MSLTENGSPERKMHFKERQHTNCAACAYLFEFPVGIFLLFHTLVVVLIPINELSVMLSDGQCFAC